MRNKTARDKLYCIWSIYRANFNELNPTALAMFDFNFRGVFAGSFSVPYLKENGINSLLRCIDSPSQTTNTWLFRA